MSNNLSLLSVTRDIVNTISRICIFLIFFMYLGEAIGNTPVNNPIGIIFIVVTCFIDYFARKKCNNFIKYLLLYLIMMPVLLILPIIDSEKVILGVYLALTYFSAIKFWTSEETSKYKCVIAFPTEMIILLIPLYFHSIYRLSDGLTIAVLIFSIAFISLSFIDQFLDKLLTYMLSIPNGSVVPLTKVFATNISSIMIVILISCLVIFAISDLTVGDSIILSTFGIFAKFIAKGIVNCAGFANSFKLDSPYTEDSTSGETGSNLEAEVVNSLEHNDLAVFISDIISIILLVAFFIFIVVLTIKFIKMYLRKESSNNDVVEKANVTIIENEKKKKKAFLNIFKAKNNNEKIRRIYKKKISVYNGTFISIEKNDTPKDIEAKIKNKSGDNLKELTDIYEAARYSNIILSDSELSITQKILKK